MTIPWLVALGIGEGCSTGKLEDTPERHLIPYIEGYVRQKERAWIAQRTMDGKLKTAKAGRLPNGTDMGM